MNAGEVLFIPAEALARDAALRRGIPLEGEGALPPSHAALVEGGAVGVEVPCPATS